MYKSSGELSRLDPDAEGVAVDKEGMWGCGMEDGIDYVCDCVCCASAMGAVGGPGVGVSVDGGRWVFGVADDTSTRTSGGLGVATSSPPPGSPGTSALDPSAIMAFDPFCVIPSCDPSSIDPSFVSPRDPDIPPLTDPGV